MTNPKPHPTLQSVNKILDTLLSEWGASPAFEEEQLAKASTQIHKLFVDWANELIGEDYVFDRPKDDYLPNVYTHLKAKNELRQEIRERASNLNQDKD